MNGRCSRRNRKKISSDKEAKLTHLQQVIKKLTDRRRKSDLDAILDSSESLTIGFISFNDNALKSVTVSIETKLEKVERKGSNALNKIVIGKSNVSVNFENNHNNWIPAVCISKDKFDSIGIDSKGTYQLTFGIEDTASAASRKDSLNGPPTAKQSCIEKNYTAELPIFDKSGKNLICSGIYEIMAKEKDDNVHGYGSKYDNPKNGNLVAEWLQSQEEMKYSDEDSNPFDAFDKEPKIHMYLEWTKKPLTGNNIKKPENVFENNNNNKENLPLSNIVGKQTNGHTRGIVKREEKPCLIQFVVDATTKQRTEERFDFTCPWCILKCPHLYGMMCHLRNCHSRMRFQLVDEGSKYRVDVFLNRDGSTSYEGAPHRLLTGSQSGPTRKSVVNQILVMGSRNLTFNLSEFQDNDEACFDQQHHYISGHNRIYYHTDTCIPIMPKELDYDSEGELD